MKNKYIRASVLGFVAWLVPFLASFAFYGGQGLMVDIFVFKTIMILVGAATSLVLFPYYFRIINADFVREGAIVGGIWFWL